MDGNVSEEKWMNNWKQRLITYISALDESVRLQSVNTDLMTEDEIHAKLQEGYDDMKAGRVQDATTAFAKFRESH
jgi:hypothetical protein